MPKNEEKFWEKCVHAVGTKTFKKGKYETQIPREIESYDCKSHDVLHLGIYTFEWIMKDENRIIRNPAKFSAYKAAMLFKPKEPFDDSIDLGLAMCRHCEFFEPLPKEKEISASRTGS